MSRAPKECHKLKFYGCVFARRFLSSQTALLRRVCVIAHPFLSSQIDWKKTCLTDVNWTMCVISFIRAEDIILQCDRLRNDNTTVSVTGYEMTAVLQCDSVQPLHVILPNWCQRTIYWCPTAKTPRARPGAQGTQDSVHRNDASQPTAYINQAFKLPPVWLLPSVDKTNR